MPSPRPAGCNDRWSISPKHGHSHHSRPLRCTQLQSRSTPSVQSRPCLSTALHGSKCSPWKGLGHSLLGCSQGPLFSRCTSACPESHTVSTKRPNDFVKLDISEQSDKIIRLGRTSGSSRHREQDRRWTCLDDRKASSSAETGVNGNPTSGIFFLLRGGFHTALLPARFKCLINTSSNTPLPRRRLFAFSSSYCS